MAALAYIAKRQAQERATVARREAPPPDVAAVLVSAANAARFVDPARQQREVDELIDWMMCAVSDRGLRVSPVAELAKHIVFGRIPKGDVMLALRDMAAVARAGKLESRGKYFIGIRNRLYRQYGIPFPVKTNGDAKHPQTSQ